MNAAKKVFLYSFVLIGKINHTKRNVAVTRCRNTFDKRCLFNELFYFCFLKVVRVCDSYCLFFDQ